MSKPYRIPAQDAAGSPNPSGRRIDPSSTVRFTFDGKSLTGHSGDTLASALMANGIRVVGRSFKYHRPRGILGLGAEEPNGLVALGRGPALEPNVRSTQCELFEGLEARSQNRWPSLNFDVGAVNDWFSRFIPAGFYYKTFKGPGRSGWMLYENTIRRSAGLGPAPHHPDQDLYEHFHLNCDILVVGGGVAGIATARAAAEGGARVIVADENPWFGGLADSMDGTIEGKPQVDWVAGEVTALAKHDNVHLMARTTVTGHYDHNYVLMLERVADHDPGLIEAGAPRHRLWRVRAKEIVLASGAIERPLTFADNDRPGIMLASAIRANLVRYGVAPGERGILIANNDDAYQTAFQLMDAGVTIERIIDVRPDPRGYQVDMAKASGIHLNFGSGIREVLTKKRGQQITGVKVGTIHLTDTLLKDEHIPCDFIAMSGGWNPAVHLYSHAGGKLAFDENRQIFVPGDPQPHLVVVGTANGDFALSDIVNRASECGERVAQRATGKKRVKMRKNEIAANAHYEENWQPIWSIPPKPGRDKSAKQFIDFQNDVVVSGLELAVREGYRSVEHIKRYTTLGMATDQGKTSNINALGIISNTLDKPIPDIGTTTFRPPYTPISFGAIAGLQAGDLFQAVRQSPVSPWHEANNADFEPVGQWRRPFCFPKPGEDREAAINREILAVRNKAGMIDLSTLGKIEVEGPDAGIFLDRIYTNMMSTLKEGRCRYGLTMDDQGYLIDDGVVVRLGDNRFLMHTTSGNSDHMAGWLEFWLQTEWPDLKAFVTPVTEQWAQFAVAGPHARDILKKLRGTIKWDAESFPFLAMRTGKLLGQPVRVYRISYSGELSFEIAIPAHSGMALWEAILEAGEEFGLEPYGTEALHVLRAEKGFIAIGDETDGTVTPLDLGLNWAVSKKKKDFIGRHSLQRPFMADHKNRKQLVGILTNDPAVVLPIGTQVINVEQTQPPPDPVGHISSSYWSPTLERSIAMALITGGTDRYGETVYFPVGNSVEPGTITEPFFYDKEGARQNV